jgi:hypothetical protein
VPAADEVRGQALEVARGWSLPGAPRSWRLTAALFEAIAADDDLLGMLAALPPAAGGVFAVLGARTFDEAGDRSRLLARARHAGSRTAPGTSQSAVIQLARSDAASAQPSGRPHSARSPRRVARCHRTGP